MCLRASLDPSLPPFSHALASNQTFIPTQEAPVIQPPYAEFTKLQNNDLVFSLYCSPGDEKHPPFNTAKRLYEKFSHAPFDQQTDCVKRFCSVPRPQAWQTLSFPATHAYCVLAPGDRWDYVGAYGNNREAVERASCVALAALKVMHNNHPLTAHDSTFIRVVEKFRNLLHQTPPPTHGLPPLQPQFLTPSNTPPPPSGSYK